MLHAPASISTVPTRPWARLRTIFVLTMLWIGGCPVGLTAQDEESDTTLAPASPEAADVYRDAANSAE